MSGGQGKSFINLGSKLREGIAQQDYGDKYVEFVVQPTDYEVAQQEMIFKTLFLNILFQLHVVNMGSEQ